jgi:hypothetical protein
VSAIAQEYVTDRHARTLVVPPDNQCRHDLNDVIRRAMQREGHVGHCEDDATVVSRRQEITGADRQWADRYKKATSFVQPLQWRAIIIGWPLRDVDPASPSHTASAPIQRPWPQRQREIGPAAFASTPAARGIGESRQQLGDYTGRVERNTPFAAGRARPGSMVRDHLPARAWSISVSCMTHLLIG